jgi:UDP-3-O-[3-hydroxymyristoyl] glucosamine N-acyltransferase
MQFTAAQIAELLQGTVEGDPQATVTRLSKIEEGGAGSLSFLANPAYAQYVYGTTASVVIIGKDFPLTASVKTTLVRVADAQGAFAKVLEMYDQIKRNKKGVSSQAVISDGATHGTDCYIGPLAFIGENARIGNNVKIYPQAYIGDNVSIGDNTTVFRWREDLFGLRGGQGLHHPQRHGDR